MKTRLSIIPFKNLLCAVVICTGMVGTSFAQCNASFTYTATTSSITVNSTSTGTTVASQYNWTLYNGSGVAIDGAAGTSTFFSNLYNQTYSLSLIMNDSAGCVSTTSQTIAISGGANAPACSSTFSFAIGSGGQVTFTNTSPADPYPNSSYYWTFNDNTDTTTSSTSGVINHTYFYDHTYTVTLNVNNALNNCSTSSTQTLSITGTNPYPSCTSNFTYTLGTSAGQASFTSLYTGLPSKTKYYWSFGGTSSSPSYTYAYNGTYSVTLQVSDSLAGCWSSTTQTLTITNAATAPCTPTVTFNMHKDSLNPLPGVWIASTYYSPQVTNAKWYWGDGSSTLGLAPTHTYSAAGHYNVCVTVFSACGDTSQSCQNDSLYRASANSTVIQLSIQNVNQTAITANSSKVSELMLYPNPNQGKFTIQLGNTLSNTETHVIITNILGEIIYNSLEQTNSNDLLKEIDLRDAESGTYFMKVYRGGHTYTRKVIVNN